MKRGVRARIGKVGELHAPTRLSHARSLACSLVPPSSRGAGTRLRAPACAPACLASRRHEGPLSLRVCSVSARPQHAPCR